MPTFTLLQNTPMKAGGKDMKVAKMGKLDKVVKQPKFDKFKAKDKGFKEKAFKYEKTVKEPKSPKAMKFDKVIKPQNAGKAEKVVKEVLKVAKGKKDKVTKPTKELRNPLAKALAKRKAPVKKSGSLSKVRRGPVFKPGKMVRRARRGVRTLQKMKYYQRTKMGELWLAPTGFRRLVLACIWDLYDGDNQGDVTFAEGALAAIQLAVEASTLKMIRQARTACYHAKRVTVREDDLQTARAIIEDSMKETCRLTRQQLLKGALAKSQGVASSAKAVAAAKARKGTKEPKQTKSVEMLVKVGKSMMGGDDEEDELYGAIGDTLEDGFDEVALPKRAEIDILARKAGVMVLGASLVPSVRQFAKDFLSCLLHKALVYRDASRRKRLSSQHVRMAADDMGFKLMI